MGKISFSNGQSNNTTTLVDNTQPEKEIVYVDRIVVESEPQFITNEVVKEVLVEKPIETIKEIIVEKIVEVPVEIIKEVPKEIIKEVIVEKIKAVEVKVVDDKLTDALQNAVKQNEAIILINKSYFKQLQELSEQVKKYEYKIDWYNKLYTFSFICLLVYVLLK